MAGESRLEHIAIIMDGNGRWAKNRGLPRVEGHRRGVNATYAAVEYARKNGIKHLSLFAFSSENWSRPKLEVSFLFKLFSQTLNKYIDEFKRQGIKIIFSGDRSPFSKDFKALLINAEAETKDNKSMTLNIAFNYGGRWDIKQGIQAIVNDAKAGKLDANDINDELISSYLQHSELPSPDLFIRTSGEHRISNFFLWQAAYTELYFTDIFWPDFTHDDFAKAIDWYQSRQRRFGNIEAVI